MTGPNPLTDPQLAGTWTLDPERSSVRFTSRTLWGLVPVAARGEIDRTRWGVSGNMLGMMPPATTLLAEAVFAR